MTWLAMRGMDAMDGVGTFGFFCWLWIAMSAAMMLPSLVPAVSLVAHLGRSSTAFVVGYFAVWAATGVAAYGAARALAGTSRFLVAGAILAAAAYQATPLKDACLRRCRNPLGLLGRRGALGSGLEHGVVCLGCCWALMLAMLALGAGSLLWMAAVAAAIFVEKVTAIGGRATLPIAGGLGVAALWVAL
jgi:predicted metal-binding membrane protein